MKDELYRDLVALTAKDGLQKYNYRPKLRDNVMRRDLTKARTDGRLVLILGAGVSLPSGLDNWEALVENSANRLLAHTAIADISKILKSSGISAIAQARFYEACAGTKTGFHQSLLDALYDKFDQSKPNFVLDALCNLILGLDGRPPVTEVITYNFDSLLEMELLKKIKSAKLPFSIFPVVSEGSYRNSKQPKLIRIFHPHGYLPYKSDFGASSQLPIVFSETDYHRNFEDTSYWANTIQLEAFERSKCLFVGLSFQCANLRRLLDYANFKEPLLHRHAAIMKVRSGGAKNFENFFVESDLNSFGVSPLWVLDYGDIPTFLASI